MILTNKKDKLSLFVKVLIILSSFSGVFFSLIYSKRDGFTFWASRLLYFTAQSNLWILILYVVIVARKLSAKTHQLFEKLYVLRFIFTVQITMTGLVYCSLIAPFAPNEYNAWTFYNIFTHVITPILCIYDFFYDKQRVIKPKDVILCAVPPLTYISISAIFSELKLDYGRGEHFPYFFMNYHSEAGLIGFGKTYPYYIGSLYWIITLGIITILIGTLYYKFSKNKKHAI